MKISEDNTVVVNNLLDIKRVIHEFLPNAKEENVEVHTKVESNGKKYDLSAPVDCNYRSMLMEGFSILKKRMQVKHVEKVSNINVDPVNVEGRMWLDDLIERRLGGVRDGLRVRWDLRDGTYYFDPFDGKLMKC